ncbi:hypothetical protein POM88_006506 [Heracleum sosnowskyi]|uniref:Uncharacterized protein n=1 Tax=Heracleum sosnowskyi TaxID=360622 RepID=A0AAD8J4Z6_9APIA|nr:hypothetical protein POM88_006506 [Heracleum sosnowskyi]
MGLLHPALIFSSLVFVLGTTSGHKTSTIAQPPTVLALAPTPVKPPVQAPLPARKLVSVRGVVYCKPCNYTGAETLLGATHLLGAVEKSYSVTIQNDIYPETQLPPTAHSRSL